MINDAVLPIIADRGGGSGVHGQMTCVSIYTGGLIGLIAVGTNPTSFFFLLYFTFQEPSITAVIIIQPLSSFFLLLSFASPECLKMPLLSLTHTCFLSLW